MKLPRYAVPAAVLLAVIVALTACNRHDEAMAPVDDTSLLTMAVEPTVDGTEVTIDIVPHKTANRVNCTAPNRLICVAIMTENGFDATTVDHTTVVFQEATEAHLDDLTGEPIRYETDIDGDGDKDLVMHFLRSDTDLTCESTQGCLEGNTFDGASIWGCDDINMFRTKPD